MAQIFYSPVDTNLRAELDARASSAKVRDHDSLQYMLGKMATVELEAFSQGDYKNTIKNSKLGGNAVLGDKFQPGGDSGFLSTISKRIPPVISSADLSLSDNSYGLSQTSTINILIPDPIRDLNFIESVYMRPGRPVKLTFAHHESAIITKKRLNSTTLPGLERLQNLYPGFDQSDLDQFGDMNRMVFLGLVKSFQITYNTDATVTVTLSVIGTTNIYTDLALIGSSKKEETDKDKKNPEDPNVTRIKSFFTTIIDQIQNRLKDETDYAERATKNKDDVYAYIGKFETTKNRTNHSYVLNGVPMKGRPEQYYVTLAYLIDIINNNIQSKITETDSDTGGAAPSAYLPYANIIFTEQDNLCVSNYYDQLVSANPMSVFIPDLSTRTYETANSDEKRWFGKIDFGDLKFLNAENKISYPTAIFINVEVIKAINENLQERKEYKVTDFIKAISAFVSANTGGAIDLKLITSPVDQTQLILYDARRTETGDIKAYHVPMFANDPRGTVVQDFSFNGKLPENISSMMTVLNQSANQLSESQLAPYLAYMYTTVDNINEIGAADEMDEKYKESLAKLEKEYEDKYKTNLDNLKKAKDSLANNWTEATRIIALQNALKLYIQTPTPKLKESIKLTAPVIPFDVEFTIDGINGLRYGDVLQFDALPLRYRANMNYSIISTTHTVDTNGIWTTKVRCVARIVQD
jgi:hypothetical protein